MSPSKKTAASSEPLVSVIIPNYNHGAYVAEAIKSVLNQTYTSQDHHDVEIIVVDDGSTDNSRSVVSQFGDRVRLICQENRGLSAARNTGIRHAMGTYIVVLDADDQLEPDYLAVLLATLKENPDAGGAYCGYRFVDEHDRPLPQIQKRVVPPEQFHNALLMGNFLVPESILLHRRCYEEAGPFDVELTACEDWDMWLRISARERLVGTPQVLTRHRVLPGSMSSDPARMIENRLQVLAKHIGPEPTLLNDENLVQRRAYGRAYLTGAVEYLQYGDRDKAAEQLGKMALIYPEGLEEVETFYELGCGDQAKGFRGHFPTLNLAESEAIVNEFLYMLGANPTISPSIRLRHVRATAYMALAMLAYGTHNRPRSRFHLARAVQSLPSLLGQSQWWGLWMRTWLNPIFRNRLRSSFDFLGQSNHAFQ